MDLFVFLAICHWVALNGITTFCLPYVNHYNEAKSHEILKFVGPEKEAVIPKRSILLVLRVKINIHTPD